MSNDKDKIRKNVNVAGTIMESAADAHQFSHNAMATTFEIFIIAEDRQHAEQAALAAFRKLDELESQLSRFIDNSDISQINRLSANQQLVLTPETFEALELCAKLYFETYKAFDVTIGTLTGCRPDGNKESEKIQSKTGFEFIKLNRDSFTIELLSDEIKIDLGGFGKGYALDKMAEVLSEWNIDTALLHGGCSTILALNVPSGEKGWPVTLSHPENDKKKLAYLHLRNQALSCSDLQRGMHIIDPRSTKPVADKIAAWSVSSDAATSDALSTAFMVMSSYEIEQYCHDHPQVKAMIVTAAKKNKKRSEVLHYGRWKPDELFL